MNAFELYLKNLNAWATVDLVLLVVAVALLMVFIIRKNNLRLAAILVCFIVVTIVVNVLSALNGGKILYGSTVVLRYVMFFLIAALCVVYQADLKSLFSKISRSREDNVYSSHNTSEDDLHDAAKEIIKSTQHMSKN
ncbi:MAG: hypothetical protein EOM87_04025, partial [Clostridia bacterium]|nr:hypothetical protein [Clostridia bacterium]